MKNKLLQWNIPHIYNIYANKSIVVKLQPRKWEMFQFVQKHTRARINYGEKTIYLWCAKCKLMCVTKQLCVLLFGINLAVSFNFSTLFVCSEKKSLRICVQMCFINIYATVKFPILYIYLLLLFYTLFI